MYAARQKAAPRLKLEFFGPISEMEQSRPRSNRNGKTLQRTDAESYPRNQGSSDYPGRTFAKRSLVQDLTTVSTAPPLLSA